jgi:two-component system, NarL family, invasion response regulator UvrY
MDSPTQQVLTILLVDDQTLVRNGVARMLADEEAITFMAEYPGVSPAIALMDARMPGIGGIEATQKLLATYPDLRIIAMSSVATGLIPAQMLQAGAQAFITKSIGIDEMLKAIRMVSQGQHYVSPEVATRLAIDPFNKAGGELFDKLSRRELQIAQMLTDGKKVSMISGLLELSPKTVYSYRYRIFEKLGIRSDVELTILAVKHGLTDDTRELDDYPMPSSQQPEQTREQEQGQEPAAAQHHVSG